MILEVYHLVFPWLMAILIVFLLAIGSLHLRWFLKNYSKWYGILSVIEFGLTNNLSIRSLRWIKHVIIVKKMMGV
jgi:hypothetical protein